MLHTILRTGLLTLSLSLLCFQNVQATPPDYWRSTGYTAVNEDKDINKALQRFAQNFGVDLELSNEFTCQINEQSSAKSAIDYLNRAGLSCGFSWFVFNNVLYVSPVKENRTARIKISPDSIAEAKPAVKGLGLLEEKFGWGEIPTTGIVLVSGPQKYIELVRQAIRANIQGKQGEQTLMVFPLRHAWVDDRRIKLRDREVIVPGVASIVRKLFGGTGSPFEGMVTASGFSASSSLANTTAVPSLMGALGGTSGSNSESMPVNTRARVEADISTNTLLIFDEPKRRKEYIELLARIDVPKKMIETQLVVIDIERRALEQLRQRWRQQLENDAAQLANNQSAQQATEVLTPTQYRKFFLELRELERTRQANILSSPSLLSVNAQPAVLDITESMRDPSANEAISTTTGARTNVIAGGMAGMIAGNNKSDGGSPTAKGNDRNTGTYLHLSARVLEGRYREREKVKEPDVVALNLEIADDQVDHSSHDFSPHHRRTLLNTQVMVQEGYSLLLGGHHIRVSEPRSQKIRERLLLLTPSIATFTQKIVKDELAPPESFFNTPVRPPPGEIPVPSFKDTEENVVG